MQDGVVVIFYIMIYRIAAIPMTLSDLQDYSPTASLFKCDCSYSCAEVDKISTDCGPSAIAQLLVLSIIVPYNRLQSVAYTQ